LAQTLLFCTIANAQIDISGFSVLSKPTKAQIEAKFGKPTSYKADNSYTYDDGTPQARMIKGVLEIYKYPGMSIQITSDCGIELFEVYSKDYPVLTNRVSAAGVRVGQKASILTRQYHMKGEKALSFSTEYSRKIGADWYYYNDMVNPCDDTFLVLIKEGIIYGFIYCYYKV